MFFLLHLSSLTSLASAMKRSGKSKYFLTSAASPQSRLSGGLWCQLFGGQRRPSTPPSGCRCQFSYWRLAHLFVPFISLTKRETAEENPSPAVSDKKRKGTTAVSVQSALCSRLEVGPCKNIRATGTEVYSGCFRGGQGEGQEGSDSGSLGNPGHSGAVVGRSCHVDDLSCGPLFRLH
uniref:Secreted protein n=1 Tax=Chromera velia CCMP2878 TaxID=1169474 RepID=A0A0G4I3I0_9ALVE|eukprot:Cvel_10682.t1-p1 / transcript=Cvel_10682.t1 / gene=Cvel_10682 / organism=Chromera_velia_CCMP2878 / gene_product=hypothetical protein / transcript_product=hypothetical protein / location=Cvel_scaffold649:42532-45353(-) / protein_length=177 / sequence_SO=supercontig / SO=protein_coding / is_pseudo=false